MDILVFIQTTLADRSGILTVTKGQWADAYGDSDGKRKATHFHPMPKPPESPGR
jgi:hypothetical protein